jgi:hypothetical protein
VICPILENDIIGVPSLGVFLSNTSYGIVPPRPLRS